LQLPHAAASLQLPAAKSCPLNNQHLKEKHVKFGLDNKRISAWDEESVENGAVLRIRFEKCECRCGSKKKSQCGSGCGFVNLQNYGGPSNIIRNL
jgi:hypothetical protein